MPSTIVDLSARSRIIHDSPFHLHYWELTVEDALAFLKAPHSELRNMGISLPEGCRIETTIENHDELGLLLTQNPAVSGGTVVCRSGGHVDERVYKISMHVCAPGPVPAVEKKLLHDRSEQGYQPHLSAGEHSRLLSLRYGLLQSPVHLQVYAFLSPLIAVEKFPRTIEAATEDFGKMTEIVAREALSKPELMAGMNAVVGAWVAQPIAPEYIRLYEHVRRPGSTLLKTYLSIIYLRALRTVIGHTCSPAVMHEETARTLSDLVILGTEVRRLLGKWDRDFVGHLVMEAETRAAEDPAFDRALTYAAASFGKLRPQMSSIISSLGSAGHPISTTTAGPSAPLEGFPENYPSGGEVRFETDCARDWWGIPAHVALTLTLLQGPIPTIEP